MVKAYYSEIDPFKAEVLREAIKAGAIAPGDVDERSIADVQPGDLAGYAQCHFFAGGGFWSLALRNAGWPDDRPVWTGSCPCPSFSAAGKGAGFADARHLWPHWFRLIRECRPAIVFGEQVSAAIGHGWLDLVQDDLEAEDYAVGKAVLGACSVGAPHIRQRLYFVADSEHSGYGRQVRIEAVEDCDQQEERISNGNCAAECVGNSALGGLGIAGSAPGSAGHADLADESLRMGIAIREGLEGHGGDGGDGNEPGRDGAEQTRPATSASESGGVAQPMHPEWWPIDEHGGYGCDGKDAGRQEAHSIAGARGEVFRQADTASKRRQRESQQESSAAQREVFCAGELREQLGSLGASIERPRPVNGFWRDADWIGCRDGKWRPLPGTAQPGALGVADECASDLGYFLLPGGRGYAFAPLIEKGKERVGRLRLYGDGIVVEVAQAFIAAVADADELTKAAALRMKADVPQKEEAQ